MFVETLPLIYSIVFSLSVSSVVFAWRYTVLRQNSIKALCSLPSVIVVGQKLSGKSSIIKLITKEEAYKHMFIDDISLYRMMGRRDIVQFVELPAIDGKKSEVTLQKFKNLNSRHIIYIFDISKASAPLMNQLKALKIIKKTFSGVPLSIVANKVYDYKAKKLKQLKKKFGKVYEIPDLENSILESKTSKSQLKRELEDVARLVNDLAVGISREKAV